MDNHATRWTPTAADCFKLNGDCSKCSVMNYEIDCKMHDTVNMLFVKFGEPPEIVLNNVKDKRKEKDTSEYVYIKDILNNYNEQQEINK